MAELETLLHKNLQSASDEELLQMDAQLGLSDLYYLNTHILKFGRELPNGAFFQIPEAETRPVCDWLITPRPDYLSPQDRRRRALILSRGTTKTSMAEGYVAQTALKNPNAAIFWTSEEKKLANAVCVDLTNRLEGEEVTSRYGILRGDKGWTGEHFTLRTRTQPRKEPTFTTGGIDVPIQGWHFDLIICDDLIGLTNCTPEGIEKVANYLNLLWPVLNPGGELLWICTRWDFDDVAARILRECFHDIDSPCPTRRVGRPAWELLPTARGYLGGTAVPGDEEFFRDKITGLTHIEPGKATYPSVLSLETMAELRKDPPTGMGLYNYSCQIENNPLPTEAAIFHSDDFRYIIDWSPSDEFDLENPAEELFRGLDYYMAFDFATGDREVKFGDDTAVHVIGVRGLNIQRQVYVVESQGGRWKPDEICDRMFLLARKWRPRLLGVEANGFQKIMKWIIEDKMRGLGIYLPLREINRSESQTSKADAIKRLQPYYAAHSIFHFQSLRGAKLEEQLIRYKPGSRIHDDYPDSLSMAFSLVEEGYQISRLKLTNLKEQKRRKAKRIRVRSSVGWY